MAKTLSHFNISFLLHLPKRIHSPISISFLISPLRKPKPAATASLLLSNSHPPNPTFSTTSTSYPLQYELIHHRPSQNPHHPHRRRLANSKPRAFPDSDSDLDPVEPDQSDLSFEDWVDKKLTDNDAGRSTGREKSNTPDSTSVKMDKSKRKYYNKRRKRMYGSDSEDDSKANSGDGFVELKPEFVELRTLHKREEELYFYDTFAYPWEKGKHYKMVYQLEKKYFPDQCFDNAFLQPGEGNKVGISKGRLKRGVVKCNAVRGEIVGEGEVDKGLIFFEDKNDGDGKDKNVKPEEVSEKKVEDFFKCLKKVPNNKNGDVSSSASSSSASDEPFLASRSNGLPPQWDTPTGTVVLINKPKGNDLLLSLYLAVCFFGSTL